MKKKDFKRYKENYRARGISMLLVDLLRKSINEYDLLTAWDGGEIKHYVSGEILRDGLRDALKICSTNKSYYQFRNKLPLLISDSRKKLDKILKNKKVTKNDWVVVEKTLLKASRYYAKLDFDFYSEREIEKFSDTTKENFKNFLKLKNIAREKLSNEIFMGENCYFERLVRKIAKQCKISEKNINFYTSVEIENLLDGKKVGKRTIKARNDTFIIYSLKSKVHRVWGKQARNILEFLEKRNNKESTINGLVAHKTKEKIIGRAIIVRLDFKKMSGVLKKASELKKGDIVVVDATSPEIAPFIKKAGAIVADWGGLNTHAAIIARELKIPCIVGTGNATEVLKDGDLVEVDANKGVVRIIENN